MRAKKMRQDGVAEFISASLTLIIFRLSVNFLHIFYVEDYGIGNLLYFQQHNFLLQPLSLVQQSANELMPCGKLCAFE